MFSVYDVSSKQSFMKLDQWINELETHSTKHDIVTMLVGNKIDKVTRHSFCAVICCAPQSQKCSVCC